MDEIRYLDSLIKTMDESDVTVLLNKAQMLLKKNYSQLLELQKKLETNLDKDDYNIIAKKFIKLQQNFKHVGDQI